jgi:nitroimidazol reductase NimA-like FMN-containing flavoprotein (pyridoxamine 5'-phosphate oxidase superfamily)
MSTTPVPDVARRLEELDEPTCFDLVRSRSVGRVVCTDGALPIVVPVNYVVGDDGRHVWFRTSAGSRLARATDDAVVAFEVDVIDESMHVGWSVVITGLARAVTSESGIARAHGLRLVAWAEGERPHFVRITPTLVTGRRLAPAGAA